MNDLIQLAKDTLRPMKLKTYGQAGHVAAALETESGDIYTGVCIDVPCSIGLCAEQAAIADMVKHGETGIKRIVAVYEDGNILPPCGRCRELMSLLDNKNQHTLIAVSDTRTGTLEALLPERWDAKWD